MSYRALMDAATLADRLKKPNEAKLWRSQAMQLKSAWQKENLPTTPPANPKAKQPTFSAFTTALWPSAIAEGDRTAIAPIFQKRWESLRDAKGAFRPASTSMQANISEAHQWTLLDQPEKVWETLKWAWQNQASSGLYTWSSDRNELSDKAIPKSFAKWQRLRGWNNQTQLTPHYWTNAEMLLLQLDMLGYINRSSNSPTLIIGAGISQEWLSKPMSVKGLAIAGNLVDWNWDGKQMNVQVKGETLEVKLGSVFPSGTPLKVEILPKDSLKPEILPKEVL